MLGMARSACLLQERREARPELRVLPPPRSQECTGPHHNWPGLDFCPPLIPGSSGRWNRIGAWAPLEGPTDPEGPKAGSLPLERTWHHCASFTRLKSISSGHGLRGRSR